MKSKIVIVTRNPQVANVTKTTIERLMNICIETYIANRKRFRRQIIANMRPSNVLMISVARHPDLRGLIRWFVENGINRHNAEIAIIVASTGTANSRATMQIVTQDEDVSALAGAYT